MIPCQSIWKWLTPVNWKCHDVSSSVIASYGSWCIPYTCFVIVTTNTNCISCNINVKFMHVSLWLHHMLHAVYIIPVLWSLNPTLPVFYATSMSNSCMLISQSPSFLASIYLFVHCMQCKYISVHLPFWIHICRGILPHEMSVDQRCVIVSSIVDELLVVTRLLT